MMDDGWGRVSRVNTVRFQMGGFSPLQLVGTHSSGDSSIMVQVSRSWSRFLSLHLLAEDSSCSTCF